ncbi:MAG: DUF6384 family protein [Paracoccaceae bacterium]|nr:DUF6384 family protein [Paracoccaceae bacterium]
MAETAAPPAADEQHGRKLDDVMLAMDVVDTLRHSKSLVDRELGSEGRDAALIERLREIYDAQGIDVPDEILLEGVEALKRQRFSYEPVEPGLTTTLARIYVKRSGWAPPLGLGLAVLLAIWGTYYFLVSAPERAVEERQAIELTESLPAEITSLQTEIRALAKVRAAREKADALAEDGLAAAKAGNLQAARTARADLSALRARLVQTYRVRIVSRPGEPSGVWRVPDANTSKRNYYLILEAIADDGQTVPVDILSEEDGSVHQVSKWGLRVREAVFERIRRDKSDDGIIQQNPVGLKRRGYLDPEYTISTPGGTIVEW